MTIDLLDPQRRFDPLNAASPFWFQGKTQLVAGVPVEVFAEVIEPVSEAITTFVLFTGTADRWLHDVERNPMERRTHVTATGAVKAMVHTNFPEAEPVGAGDTTAQRVDRLAEFFACSPASRRSGPSRA